MLKGFILAKGVNDAKEFRKIHTDFDNKRELDVFKRDFFLPCSSDCWLDKTVENMGKLNDKGNGASNVCKDPKSI